MEIKTFDVTWTDRVERSVEIEAKTEAEAKEKWKNGEYESKNILENDCDTLSEDDGYCVEINEV